MTTGAIMPKHHTEGYLHLAMHRKITDFSVPKNSDMLYDVLDDHIISNKLISYIYNDFNGYASGTTHDIPISYRYLLYRHTLEWSSYINKVVFEDQLYNLFYIENSNIIEKVIHVDPEHPESVIYRDYKTGISIFHTAAKIRLITTIQKHLSMPVGKQLLVISNELTNIRDIYAKLGELCESGSELTINYIEDFSGVYLIDFLKKYSEELMDSMYSKH